MFLGTYCAAPVAAGVLAEALFKARQAVGDAQVGPVKGSLLTTRRHLSRGPADDGILTYTELFDAAKAVAAWKPFDPNAITSDPFQAFTTPTTPLALAYEGFGLLDRPSVLPLAKVLLGENAQTPRPEMQQWTALASTTRSSRWGSAPTPH